MQTLEQIAYDAGRSALSDQRARVTSCAQNVSIVGLPRRIDGLPDPFLARSRAGIVIVMHRVPTPADQIKVPPAWKIGIEETRGAPRPWIWNAEAARQHRLEHPSPLRRLLIKLGLVKQGE